MIRKKRKAMRMSQMLLAEKVGVSYQQIQKYEKGFSEITISRLCQIAEALGIDPASFLPSKDMVVAESVATYGKSTPEEESLLHLFRQLRRKKMRESLLLLLKEAVEIERKK